MYSHKSKMETATMSCKDIFTEIVTRQHVALMYHDQMATYFDFLGLHGFKRMHEYQYYDESIKYRKTKRYFLNHHNWLIERKEAIDPKAVPTEWYKYSRMDVSPSIKQKAVKDAFEEYRKWEEETKECYSIYAHALYEKGNVSDGQFVEKLVCDVDMELKHLDRIVIDLIGVSYDMIHIVEMQKKMHDKYKCKMCKLGKHM